jgi:hypothetical protein
MEYKVIIPSYKRTETLKNKTLKVLDYYKIPTDKIEIWVADNSEYEIYKKAFENTPYQNNIMVGVPTLGAQRNYIERYYPEGTRIMYFDDDIEGIFKKNENKLETVIDLENDIIIRGFNECEKTGAKLFGIYAAGNPFFMKHQITTGLCYIIGAMFGTIVQHDSFLVRQTNHGEDYENSLRQYIYNGALVRFDDITIKTKYYGEPGGLQEIRTEEYIHNSIKKISMMFPNHCKMYIRKTTGHAELRLKDNTPKPKLKKK